MENVGNGDPLEDEVIEENQVNPQEEEEINETMQNEGMSEAGNMFGGGEDGAMMSKMGVNPENPEDAANELEHAEEHFEHENQDHEHGEHEEHVDPNVEQYFENEEMNNGHDEIDHEIPEENLDHEHEYQGDDEIPGDQIIDHGLVAMDHHTELEKMKNFKKISDDCKIFLEQFRDCLDNIPDPAWDQTEIQKCVGKDFTRVVNDICK